MKKLVVIFVITVLALTACGGGGGEKGQVAKTRDIIGVISQASPSVAASSSTFKADIDITIICKDEDGNELPCTKDITGKFKCPCVLGKIYTCEGPQGTVYTFDADGDGSETSMVSDIPCYPGVGGVIDAIDLGSCDENTCTGNPYEQIDRDGDGFSDADDPNDTIECTSSEDCPSSRVCSQDICDVQLCSTNSDCPSDRSECWESFLCSAKCGDGSCEDGGNSTCGEKTCEQKMIVCWCAAEVFTDGGGVGVWECNCRLKFYNLYGPLLTCTTRSDGYSRCEAGPDYSSNPGQVEAKECFGIKEELRKYQDKYIANAENGVETEQEYIYFPASMTCGDCDIFCHSEPQPNS